MDFILQDHTNWNEYTDDYNCVNFSLDLVLNAEKIKIHAWIVAVNFADQPRGHTFVGFKTNDKGIIWIEPQSDDAYIVSKIGQPLCLANNPNLCWSAGLITNILDPASCNPLNHECWSSSAK